MRKFFLLVSIILVLLQYVVLSQPVKNQVVNNISFPGTAKLFVFSDNVPVDNQNGIGYREATTIFDVTQKLKITDNVSDTFEVEMTPSPTGFFRFINGINDTAGYFNPYNRNIKIKLTSSNIPDPSLIPGKAAITLMNGCTDAPLLYFDDGSAFDNIWAYSLDYNSGNNLPVFKDPEIYNVKIKDANKDTLIGIFKIDLRNYANKALCIFTSGFLLPSKNHNGPGFGLFAVLQDGQVIQFPPILKPTITIPVLLSPVNNSIDRRVTDTLRWLKASGALTYDIQISKDINFVDVVVNTTISDTFFKYNNLEFKTKYYWRVLSKNQTDSSVWSQYWSFTTVADSQGKKPDDFTIIYPTDRSKDIPLDITLTWHKSNDAASYSLYVWKGGGIGIVLLDTTNLTDTVFYLKNLDFETLYEWGVIANNEYGKSYQTQFLFTTILPTNKPLQAVLLYPQDNEDKFNIKDSLVWHRVYGAKNYHIQVAKDRDFTTLVSNNIFIDTIYFDSNFEYNQNYYWRVRGENSIGAGEWSEIYQFKAKDYTSVEPDYPNNGLIIHPNPAYDILEIYFPYAGVLESYSNIYIDIFTLEGIKVLSSTSSDRFAKIDVSFLPCGRYFLKLSIGGINSYGHFAIVR